MRRVRQHGDFIADYREQLSWLVEHAEPSWIEDLIQATDRLMTTLATFPSSGKRIQQRSGAVLRSVGLPQLPYVVWYVYAPGDRTGDIWLVRLFHGRRERPEPDIRAWLPVRG